MELILITKDQRLAKYAEDVGIDIIMIDLEILGKKSRQGHLNTVISDHRIEDISKIKEVLRKPQLLVRINPIHEQSQYEIEEVINRGADIVMLPMFRTVDEVKFCIDTVDGRALIYLLLETPQALVKIDDILELDGIDGIYVGLNDLHLAMGLDFMFELLSGGIVEYLANKITIKNVKFGFGGISRLGKGLLDSRLILSEHYRLNSKMVILSRDFKCYTEDYEEIIKKINLKEEIAKIRNYISCLGQISEDELERNRILLKRKVKEIVRNIRENI